MEFNNELTQRTGVVGAGDEGTTSRPSDGGHSIYVTASSTKMDTVVFMHKWSISQFSVQQELSNAGEFLESKFVSIIYLYQLIARLICNNSRNLHVQLQAFYELPVLLSIDSDIGCR
uniref:Uncharacterized protein n=1 Tax=Parascaris equorum TaxID=6256 RepID=A0A914RUF1_PAREQ